MKRDSRAREILTEIIGKRVDNRFGSPIIDAFGSVFTGIDHKATESAGLECMLYLSHLKTGFTLQKLRAFHISITEEISLFSFNCKDYDKIFACIPQESLSRVILLNNDSEERSIELNKEDIFDAFDFFTNR